MIFVGLAQMKYYNLDVHSCSEILHQQKLFTPQELGFLHNLHNCACKFSCCKYAINNKKKTSSFLIFMCICSKQVAQSRMKPGVC